jgi:cytochrome oxidase Cu insertion factor (SCO1/SenC/PrrC family)
MSLTRTEMVVWAVVGFALVGVVALAFVAGSQRKEATTEQPSADADVAGVAQTPTSGLLPQPAGELGEHACVERSGRKTNTSELHGKVVVLDFIFTSCGGICPEMTAKMKELQTATASLDDLRLVSITVDPDRDVPAMLEDYARAAGADKERWLFLRCEKRVLADIAYDRMHLVKARDELVSHQPKFALLDRAGRVRGYYDALHDPKWLEAIVRDINVLRAEPRD